MRKDVARIQGFLQTINNVFLKKILNPALRKKNPDPSTMQSLMAIGRGIGLEDPEIHSATRHYTGAFSRFCSRLIFFTILAFILFVAVAGLANNDSGLEFFFPSNTTYLPGTRYASIKPEDFA